MNNRLIAGNRVKHATRTDWGLGEVVESEQDGMVTVFFEDVGLKKFNLSVAQFLNVEGDESASDYLTALVKHHKRSLTTGLVKKSGGTTFQKAVENFRSFFPMGFQDPTYLAGHSSERDYKMRAHELLIETLGPNVLPQLLAEQKYKEICHRTKSVINKTNLINQYEKIWLSNGLALEDAQESFARSLCMLMYGDQPLQERFEQFASMLYKINAAKWPIATYFLFLSDPGAQVFVKPEVTKSAAEVLGIDINYKPELNWLTYSQVLRLAEAIRSKLVKEGPDDLVPRDMIDVQSFMWVTAPSYT